MPNYFCARISQEYSEKLRLLALNSGVSEKNIVFSTIGCPFCTLDIYIKFKEKTSLESFSNDANPYILERW